MENQTTNTRHDKKRPVIYQMIPRVFANFNDKLVPNGPITINGSGKLNDINADVLSSIKSLGATHVWYTGVIEHGHDADYTAWGIPRHNPNILKGRAGSPYAITDYYDIDPDLAVSVPDRINEFEALVGRTHRAGMKVIIDFVPNHVGRQYASDKAPAGVKDLGADDKTDWFFSPSNNFYYIPRQQFSPVDVDLGQGNDAYVEFPARATGNDCFTAFPGRNDWYETIKLNYGIDPANGSRHFDPIPDTWLKMLHILRYWASKNIDGFRCDMAHMVPIEFWKWAIRQVKETYPDIIFIAEIYDVGLYRPYLFEGGFDYLYDKVNLYDTLRGIECHNVSAARLTSCWQTVEGISDRMLNFLENHDEQRYASDQYAGNPKTVLPSLTIISTMSRGAVMVYSAQELGERAEESEGFSGKDGRSTIFDYWSIDKLRRWLNHGHPTEEQLTDEERALRHLYSEILTLVNNEPAIKDGLFFDLMYVNYENPDFNPHRQFAYIRSTKTESILIVVNFDGHDCEVGVNIPDHAFSFLELPVGKVKATNLLDGSNVNLQLTPATPVKVALKAHGAALLKFTHPKNRPFTAKKR